LGSSASDAHCYHFVRDHYLERRRFTFQRRLFYALDIDLDIPDGALGKSRSGVDFKEQDMWRRFVKPRDLDVDQHGRVVGSKSDLW